MKTTLNFPDEVIREAKIRAAAENTTLTRLILEGLDMRLKRGASDYQLELPVSAAEGGLRSGYSWESIAKSGEENSDYR
jgi:hypothetical protein